MRERDELDVAVKSVRELEAGIRDNVELIELGEAEGDAEIVKDAEEALLELRQTARRRQIETLLSGEVDANDCYVEIHSGAGGTESQDWANMLLRMYTRWAERRKMKVEVLEMHDGEEAGIKSATIKVSGHNAYGWLKTESGVHRLVRISPYDSAARRHTSFSSCWVYPVVHDSIDIEIRDADLKVDTYRASGAGGQHINKTDSAVRITHNPTGIVVECQEGRSQHANKAQAMAVLAARIKSAQVNAQQSAIASERKSLIGSGDRSERIRTYNYPQGRITDHRINLTLYKIDAITEGDMDELIGALSAEHQADLLASLGDDN